MDILPILGLHNIGLDIQMCVYVCVHATRVH